MLLEHTNNTNTQYKFYVLSNYCVTASESRIEHSVSEFLRVENSEKLIMTGLVYLFLLPYIRIIIYTF